MDYTYEQLEKMIDEKGIAVYGAKSNNAFLKETLIEYSFNYNLDKEKILKECQLFSIKTCKTEKSKEKFIVNGEYIEEFYKL